VESTANDLTNGQRQQLFVVLLEFVDVFAADSADLGHTHCPAGISNRYWRYHPYQTASTSCSLCTSRRGSEAFKIYESRKIVQPSKSPWASPVVLVKKKDGTMCFCIDYRKLNVVTHKDAYLLPRINDTLHVLSGSQWFNTIELLSGYWQVGIAEKNKKKTAFTTQERLFEFNVMPFGLCNAPATFRD